MTTPDVPVPPWIEGEQPVESLEAQRWEITGIRSAEWAMARAAQYDARLAEIDAEADHWRRMIDDWVDRQSREARRSSEFFHGHLERFALAQREATGEATLRLPSGEVRTRKGQGRFVVTDEDAALCWAPDEATRRRLLVSKVKDHVEVVQRLAGWLVPVWSGQEMSRFVPVDGPDEQGDPDPVPEGATPVYETVIVVKDTGEIADGLAWKPAEITATVVARPLVSSLPPADSEYRPVATMKVWEEGSDDSAQD